MAWLRLPPGTGVIERETEKALDSQTPGALGFGLFFFSPQAAGFVDCILGDLLVISLSKQRMNNSYNYNVKKNEVKDLIFIECQHGTVWHFICLC